MEKRCYGCMKLKNNSPICEHCGFDERRGNEPHQLPFGTLLRGQYIIGRVLGQGGFGITYLGWDRLLNVPVAIKEYFPSGLVMRDNTQSLALTGMKSGMSNAFRSYRERFLREAQALARFSNVPEIVRVLNFFEENETAYIIMEYVEGTDLRNYIRSRGGRLSVEETLGILGPVMRALTMIHRSGLIHRDISPDNIMLLPYGGAKLLDFGAVRDVGDADAERMLSQSTEAILKHGFAPLEQYQRRGSLGPWTDIYALCATIYYCMTGRVPPDAPARMMDDVHPDWRSIPGLSPYQAAALEKGMGMRAKDRFASVEELSAALFSAPRVNPSYTLPLSQEEPVYRSAAQQPPVYTAPVQETPLYTAPVEPPVFEEPPKPSPKPKPKGLLAAVAVLAAVVIGISVMNKQDKKEEPMTLQGSSITLPGSGTEPAVTIPDKSASGSTMMADVPSDEILENLDSDDYPVFGSQYTRGSIKRITFYDTLNNVPDESWDISQNQDGSVMAWAVRNTQSDYGTYYDLFIAGDGGILAPEDCTGLFAGYSWVTSVDFNGCFYTDETVDMRCMFDHFGAYGTGTTAMDLSTFNTSRVTDMERMFYGAGPDELDLRNFDTSKVTTMEYMFGSCYDLVSLNVAGFDTSSLINAEHMFDYCTGLTALDVSNFDTSNVTKMNYMFNGCKGLISLDLSNFDTSNVTGMMSMFAHCESLVSLDVSSFDTSKVTMMAFMFGDCYELTDLDISNFDFSSIKGKPTHFMDDGRKVNGRPWEELFE